MRCGAMNRTRPRGRWTTISCGCGRSSKPTLQIPHSSCRSTERDTDLSVEVTKHYEFNDNWKCESRHHCPMLRTVLLTIMTAAGLCLTAANAPRESQQLQQAIDLM